MAVCEHHILSVVTCLQYVADLYSGYKIDLICPRTVSFEKPPK